VNAVYSMQIRCNVLILVCIAILGVFSSRLSKTSTSGSLISGKSSAILSTSSGKILPQALYIKVVITPNEKTRSRVKNHAIIHNEELGLAEDLIFKLNSPYTWVRSFSSCDYPLLSEPHKVSVYLESVSGTKYDYEVTLSHYHTSLELFMDRWIHFMGPSNATHWMIPIGSDATPNQAHNMTLEFRSMSDSSPTSLLKSVTLRNSHSCKSKSFSGENDWREKRFFDDGARHIAQFSDLGASNWYVDLKHKDILESKRGIEMKVTVVKTYNNGFCMNGRCNRIH